MKNMREVFRALLDGKNVVDSTCPSAYTYMFINEDDILCGVITDKDSNETIYLLTGNWRLVNNPDLFEIYSKETP